MQGIMYSAASGTAFAAATAAEMELIQLGGDAAAIGVIHELRIGQTTEAGDAAAEMLEVKIFRATTLGAGTTMEALEGLIPGSPVAKLLPKYNSTTLSTVLSLIHADAFNVQAGWLYLPTPETRVVVPAVATEGVVVQISAPLDSITFSVTVVWEEIGIT